ncbi:MAG: aminotransferase class I/II-fold pyridoxal phosphate-dependent enzyme, partial [Bacteroidales bacterium]|nr:aminotransferase class I/II-fold pyridoxal phosphate-dependent enzyme [Bacteroidales bacterium]
TLDQHELKAFILTGQKWYEIDDIQDKNIAETIFSNTEEEQLDRIQGAYGGYWRFPRMIDYCYLVNPYFPTRQMQKEMKANFNVLLSSYPSGLSVQNMLAGKLFNVEEKNILTGNGAAELIRALVPGISGSIGITYPTFNEYPESFTKNQIVPFIPANFKYTQKDLAALTKKCDVLLVINPDNPSGNYIPAKEMIELLEYLKIQNKKIILDESFIDFCGFEGDQSLLRQDIINTYPNLILIRSLSKSFGIPGLRLGVLVSGDADIIKQVRFNLPIWNINSFAEFFLQIIGNYIKD